MTPLDDNRTIWLQEHALGTVQALRHRGRKVDYRVPREIDGQVTLRFKGYGRTKDQQTGDLLLCVHVDRGHDVEAPLWLADSESARGCQKDLLVRRRRFAVAVPPGSREGQVVRVPGAGQRTSFRWGLPLFGRKKGDLCARLHVFPDTIAAVYGSIDRMSDEDLTVEGWVYRRIDFVMEKIGAPTFRISPMIAKDAADLFNEGGWRGLAEALVGRLGLGSARIVFRAESALPTPGQCRRAIQKSQGGRVVSCQYEISIRADFLDDPFAVVAILAHELCHAVHSRCLAPGQDHVSKPGPELLEEERTVDLLVFMFQLGEFQMRVARQRRVTLGYFNQPLFERMHVILGRKRQVWTWR